MARCTAPRHLHVEDFGNLGRIFLLLAVLAVPTGHAAADAHSDLLDALIDQVQGGSCRYMADYTLTEQDSACKRRPFYYFPFLKGAPSRYVCVYWAAKCLGDMGSAARPAVPALLKALREGPNDYDTGDGTIGTRSEIARALGQIGDPSAIPGLIEALESATPYDRYSGGHAGAHPAAARSAIATALGSFGVQARSAGPALMKVLEDSRTGGDHDTAAAALALGRIGAKEAVPLLVHLLGRKDWTSTSAAEALGSLGPDAEAATGPLCEIVLSESLDPLTKWRAAVALGKIGDPRSVPVLAKALSDPALAQPAAQALSMFGKEAEPALSDLIALLKRPTGATVNQATGAIHYSGQAGSLHSAKVLAVSLLAKINTRDAFDALVAVLPDPELANTSVVIKGLLSMDPEETEVRQALVALARSADPVSRWVGARGLARLQRSDIVLELIPLLQDDQCRVRDAAIRGLCAHASSAQEALPALVALSASADRCTPGLVSKAIQRIGSHGK